MLQSASLSAEMQGSLQTKTVYAPPFFARSNAFRPVAARFPCFLRNGCRTECLLHRAARNMPARVSGFCGQTARIPSRQVRCRTFGNPRRCSSTAQQHTPLARHKPFGKCANSFLVRSLKCCLDRTHLAEHQLAEKLAVIIARCNRFVFGKTSGKRNSQLRKTAVARRRTSRVTVGILTPARAAICFIERCGTASRIGKDKVRRLPSAGESDGYAAMIFVLAGMFCTSLNTFVSFVQYSTISFSIFKRNPIFLLKSRKLHPGLPSSSAAVRKTSVPGAVSKIYFIPPA